MSRVAPRAIAYAIVTALLAAVFLPTTAAGVAAAHAGGLTSSASLPRVLAVEPAVPGVTVAVVESGARLRLDNTSTSTVTVQPLPGSQLSGLPTVEPGGTAYWSDPRITTAAAQDRPRDGMLPWQVPLLVGDTPATVRGEQVWPPAPAAALWWLLALACAAVPVLLGLLGRDRRWGPVALAAATGVVIAAHLAHVAGSAVVPEQQPYALMVLSAANFGVAAWLVGAAGIVAVVRNRSRVAAAAGGAPGGPQGSSTGLLMCCVAGALLGLIVTPVDVLSFHDAIVPFAWGAGLDRLLIAITLGGGLGVAAAAVGLLRRTAPA